MNETVPCEVCGLGVGHAVTICPRCGRSRMATVPEGATAETSLIGCQLVVVFGLMVLVSVAGMVWYWFDVFTRTPAN